MRVLSSVFVVMFAFAAASPALAIEGDAPPLKSKHAAAGPLSGVVVDEQGSPIPGAEIIYEMWSGGTKKTVAAKSDERGRFVLQLPPLSPGAALSSSHIWAGAQGRRLLHLPPPEKGRSRAEPLRLVLAPPADVPVTVRGPDGKPFKGAQITLPTFAYANGRALLLPKALIPFTSATTDEQGVARLTALDRNALRELRVTTPEYGSQSRHVSPQAPEDAQPLQIMLRSAGRVRGRLVAAEPGVTEGVAVMLLSFPNNQTPGAGLTLGVASAVSDKDGRFEVPALAEGVIRHIVVQRKPDHPFVPLPPANVAIGGGQTVEIEIPFQRAVRVHGVVRDKVAGTPMPGVMIGIRERGGNSTAPATTGEDGRFEFLRIPGQLNLYLALSDARGAGTWFRQSFHRVPAGKRDFELPPIELMIARGRVVDAQGRGVAGVKIEKAVTRIELDGRQIENTVFSASRQQELLTDANGEYRAWIEVGAAYRVQIHAEGRAPQWNEWTEFRGDAPATFPDFVIDSLQAISGQVVDRQGRPAPGAKVIQSGDGPQRTEAVADKDGRFQLAGYQTKAGFVFAEKDGFRFHGQRVTPGDNEVKIVLARTTEPPERRLATLPESDPAADAALALKVLAPALAQLRNEKNEHNRRTVLQELLLVDPAEMLDRLDAVGLQGEQAEILRVEAAKAWAAEYPDDAMAIIEALDDAYSRAAAYVMSAETLPDSLRDRKLEWLGKAQVHLRGAGDPSMRMALTAYLARLLVESGQRDKARKIVAEIKPEVDKLPLNSVAAYVRGVVAEALATYDLPAALELIKDLKDDGEYDRHHGNLARLLAASRPVDAVQTLKLVRDEFQRDQCAVRVAGLLAHDGARADETVDLIARLPLKALAEGLRSRWLAKVDPEQAKLHLDRAYELLAKLAATEKTHLHGYHAAPVLAAWLLPIVETLDPGRLNEYLWRALSLRVPRENQGDRERTVLETRACLAMWLSRYDRELARELYGNPSVEAAKLSPNDFSGIAKDISAAAAIIDPSWAVTLYEKLPANAPPDAKARARSGLVDILSRHGEARWRAASGYLNLPMPWHGIQ